MLEESIVESPMDAYKCFMRTEMDYLVMGDYLLDKRSTDFIDDLDWKEEFELIKEISNQIADLDSSSKDQKVWFSNYDSFNHYCYYRLL